MCLQDGRPQDASGTGHFQKVLQGLVQNADLQVQCFESKSHGNFVDVCLELADTRIKVGGRAAGFQVGGHFSAEIRKLCTGIEEHPHRFFTDLGTDNRDTHEILELEPTVAEGQFLPVLSLFCVSVPLIFTM